MSQKNCTCSIDLVDIWTDIFFKHLCCVWELWLDHSSVNGFYKSLSHCLKICSYHLHSLLCEIDSNSCNPKAAIPYFGVLSTESWGPYPKKTPMTAADPIGFHGNHLLPFLQEPGSSGLCCPSTEELCCLPPSYRQSSERLCAQPHMGLGYILSPWVHSSWTSGKVIT